MTRFTRHSLVFLVLATLAAPVPAKKKNNPNVELEFIPQQAVAAASAAITHDMLSRPVELRVEDSRKEENQPKIGTRTDDDDRRHTLLAVNEVGPFFAGTLRDVMDDWGIETEDGAGIVLDIALVQIKVTESNQAVGATYSAEIRLSAQLQDRKGKELWSGTVVGDASRYGKKFSNDNVNEVLSDALLEATANLLSNGGLYDAWGSGK